MEFHTDKKGIKYDGSTKTLYLDSSDDYYSLHRRGEWFEKRPYDRIIVSGDFNELSMSLIAAFKEPSKDIILEICSEGDEIDNVKALVKRFNDTFSHWTCDVIFGTRGLNLKKGSVKYTGRRVALFFDHEMVECEEKEADISIGPIHRKYILRGTEEFEW